MNTDREVFEKRVVREIFVPKRDEVTGGWRQLHKEEFYNLLYSLPNIISDQIKDGLRMQHSGNEKYIQNVGWKT
jgi:hypothetical protein